MSIAEVEKEQVVNFAATTGIKGIWDSRLRSYRGSSVGGGVYDETPSRRLSSSTAAAAAAATPLGSALGGKTPSSSSSVRSSAARSQLGLTESPVARRSRSASVHVDCAAAADPGTDRRTPSAAPTAAATRKTSRSSPRVVRQERALAKPLFARNYLLQELEPHDAAPTLTLVLDLDETLVSNRSSSLSRAVLRPYCLHVLNALTHMKKKGLEIVLWTASTKETAAPVVEQLHQSGDVFDEVIFRNAMWFTEPVHTKDLRLLGRDMNRVVIVDNAANCCKLNQRNAILIEDFHGFRYQEEASLVNVYYIVEALLEKCANGVSVQDGLQQLSSDGHLCRNVTYSMPEAWKSLPLSEIAPVKIPPFGRFVKANKKPPCQLIMKHWTY